MKDKQENHREELPLKIIQFVTHLALHDAIGNEVLAMDDLLKKQGYESHIMAGHIHEALKNKAEQPDFSNFSPEDLFIFHKGSGDKVSKAIASLPCKKAMVYHNITPAKYFLPYDRRMSLILFLGRLQLRRYISCMDACWADSSFNAEELLRCGANKERTRVLPILFSENKSEVIPDPETENKLKRNKATKLLCIGRIAPNKKLEDAIKLYARYRKQYDSKAVLYLVGSWEGLEKYYDRLKKHCAKLKLTEDQVVFTGRISEEEKEAYLRNTDALICMSEHEGFCVPLLEAMGKYLPVLAYAKAAIPETLGESELLFPQKDYDIMSNTLARLQSDPAFRTGILKTQQDSLKRFDLLAIQKQFLYLIQEIISEGTNKGENK